MENAIFFGEVMNSAIVRRQRDSASKSSLLENSMLIIPNHEPDEEEAAASSRLIIGRSAQRQAYESFAPRRATLTKTGLKEVERLAESDEHEEGVFKPLGSLGMAAAFFKNDEGLARVKGQLESENYTCMRNFSLFIPPRARENSEPATRGMTPLLNREWPEESGIKLAHELGIRGSGVLVGVLDTGIDSDHLEFKNKRIPFRYVSFYPTSPYWPPRDVRGFDLDGHGTHVSGIICGNSIGVAPEVELHVASVIESETTRTSMVRVTAGLDWILRQFSRPDKEYRPGIVNMSLGFPPNDGSIDGNEWLERLQTIQRLIRTLIRFNVMPISAIGNDGQGQYGYPGAFSDVLGVGAINFAHEIANFSGSGTVQFGQEPERSKPDVVGYGVSIYSAVERDYDGNSVYQRFSGTSMASPYVTGIASLYRCQQPQMKVQEVIALLSQNARSFNDIGLQARTGAGLARFKR